MDGRLQLSYNLEYLLEEKKRIEIDSVEAEYGIEPFIDYIQYVINTQCKTWDLSRIGVDPFNLDEPYNPYEELIADKEGEMTGAYREVYKAYHNNYTVIDRAVNEALKSLYWYDNYYDVDLDDILDPVREEWNEDIQRTWVPEYEDQLREVNDQIVKYEGDPRYGEEDLQSQRDEIQEELEDEVENAEGLEELEETLDDLVYGQSDLEQVEIPSVEKMIEDVIEALTQLKAALASS
jgi:hypothetical protein